MTPMAGLDERLGLAMRLGLVEGRWDDALGEVRLTLIDHSASAKALLALAVCYFHRREFVEAITWLDQAAERAKRDAGQPGDASWAAIHLFRGLAYAARRAPTAARADFAELRASDPAPIRWEQFKGVLRPDELTRARLAAEAAGLPTE